MMKYKGIIFDFNGVLLWDAPLHVQAWQATAFGSGALN
jgi:beta-phosphoglucomutase-like phosphatase (HAD superfamily)